MMFTVPVSSSIRRNTTPLAVPGRWRATTNPPMLTAAPWRMASRSALVTVPRAFRPGRNRRSGWRWTVRPMVA